MVIKAGYKMTEVGVIPEDWEVKRIGDFAIVGSGGTPRREVGTYWGGSIPWVTTSQIDFTVITEANQFITEEGLKNSPAKLLPAGTLLLALYGQGKTRGKIGILGIPAATNQACASITLQKGISQDYMLHYLTSCYETIRNSSNSGGQENLSGNIVKGIRIAFPQFQEQEEIAKTLNDVDALIAGLEKLIEKKRNIKQATMQQLLTGKTRLSGFSGEWKIKQLGDIANIKTGDKNNEDKVDDGLYPFYVRSANVERINTYSHDCEAILVPGEGQIGNIFHYIKGRFNVHQRVYVINQFDVDICGKYIYFYMSQHFGEWAMQNTVKATVDSLRLPTFKTFKVQLPPTIEEQVRISSTITELQKELATLERCIQKTRNTKHGMMQELLTGRTRLICSIKHLDTY